jgi:hypothetical protein
MFHILVWQVLKINTITGDFIVVAVAKSQAVNSDGILATSAKLNSPTNVAIDPVNGTLFITDMSEPWRCGDENLGWRQRVQILFSI